MLQKGGEPGLSRAAVYFVKWWREEGALLSASKGLSPFENEDPALTSIIAGPRTQTWGFDFQWSIDTAGDSSVTSAQSGDSSAFVQQKMEECIDDYLAQSDLEEAEEKNLSPTQIKKRAVTEEKERRKMRYAARQAR